MLNGVYNDDNVDNYQYVSFSIRLDEGQNKLDNASPSNIASLINRTDDYINTESTQEKLRAVVDRIVPTSEETQ